MNDDVVCELRVIMAKREVTNIKLSELTGLNKTYLSDLRRKRSLPGIYNCLLIARELNCQVEDIWHLPEKKPSK